MRILNMISIPLMILVTGSLVASPSAQGSKALQSPAAEHQHPLSPDALTRLPQRPDWMPLPMLFGKTSELASLTGLVKSPDPKIRAKTAFILGQMSSPKSIVPLQKLLADKDRSVRLHAGLALGYMGHASGLKTCTGVLNGHLPEWMKYYAVCGLWRIHSTEAMRVLRKASIGNSALLRSARRGALATNRTKWPKLPESSVSPNKVQELPPTFWEDKADLYEIEGDWWFHRGDYEQVIRCEEVNLFLFPGDMEVYSTIAYYQWSLGRGNQAVNTLRSAIKAYPRNPDAYYNLGLHYSVLKRYDLAEEPLRKSVNLKPDKHNRRTYAHSLERVGKLDKALAQWNAILRDYPSDDVARNNRDRVRMQIAGKK